MTTDHDRGIEAAALALANRNSSEHPEAFRGIAEAAISAYLATTEPGEPESGLLAVKVKPLEWELCDDNATYHAQSIFGRWAYWEDHYLPPDGHGGRKAEDPKAAAEADYERRIMSALSTPPQPVEARGDAIAIDRSLLEAAIAEIRGWKVAKGGDDQVALNLEAVLASSPDVGGMNAEDDPNIVLEDAAAAAFRQAQSVYRADHDHFPLKNTWQTADERIRDGWRKVATAALSAGKLNASKLNEKDIANALAPFFEEGWTARDGARAVLHLLLWTRPSAGISEGIF